MRRTIPRTAPGRVAAAIARIAPGRAAAAIAMVAAVVLAATACTGDTTTPEPTPSLPFPVIDDEPTLPRLTVGGPAWGDAATNVQALERIAFLGDAAIVSGRFGAAWIDVVDAATGEARWSLQEGATLPGTDVTLWRSVFQPVDDTADGGAGLVLVEYMRGGCAVEPARCAGERPPVAEQRLAEQGVAALSVADGSVVWTRPVIPSVTVADAGFEAGPALAITGGSDELVFALVGDEVSIYGGGDEQLTTVALDAVTGEERWRRDGVVGRWVTGDAGDTVVASTRTTGTGIGSSTSLGDMGGPVLLDAATGEERWNRTAEFPNATLVEPAGGLLALYDRGRGAGDTRPGGAVLSLADGSVVAELTPDRDVVTSTDPAVVVWSASGPDRLMSLAPGETEPGAGLLADAGNPQVAHGGYVLTAVGTGTQDSTLAVDRSGAVLSDPIPGRAFAMTDDWLVTLTAGADDGFTVHPITS